MDDALPMVYKEIPVYLMEKYFRSHFLIMSPDVCSTTLCLCKAHDDVTKRVRERINSIK